MQYLNEINQRSSGQSIIITTQNDYEKYSGDQLLVLPDSLIYFNKQVNKQHRISLFDVSDIILSESNTSLKPWFENAIKSRREIYKKTKNEIGNITLQNGNKIEGYDIDLTMDSTTVSNMERSQKTFISNFKIKQIAICNHSKGASHGLFLGGLFGLVIYPLFLTLEGKTGDISPLAVGIYMAPITVPLGALLGGALGYAVGIESRYVLDHQYIINPEKQ